jgi:uncharacterized membrane protein
VETEKRFYFCLKKIRKSLKKRCKEHRHSSKKLIMLEKNLMEFLRDKFLNLKAEADHFLHSFAVLGRILLR